MEQQFCRDQQNGKSVDSCRGTVGRIRSRGVNLGEGFWFGLLQLCIHRGVGNELSGNQTDSGPGLFCYSTVAPTTMVDWRSFRTLESCGLGKLDDGITKLLLKVKALRVHPCDLNNRTNQSYNVNLEVIHNILSIERDESHSQTSEDSQRLSRRFLQYNNF